MDLQEVYLIYLTDLLQEFHDDMEATEFYVVSLETDQPWVSLGSRHIMRAGYWLSPPYPSAI